MSHGRPVVRLARLVAPLSFSVLLSCATTGVVSTRDRFPLDPREGLTGPFSAGVEKGWRALLEGDGQRAEAEFAQADSQRPELAAEIGRIESFVIAGRPKDALAACEEKLTSAEPTAALLVGCGEARALTGNASGAYALYRRALARSPGRAGLIERTEELRGLDRDELIDRARAEAAEEKWKDARSAVARALEIAPESPIVHAAAGDVEAAAGEKLKAFHRYREAVDLGSKDPAVEEKEGDLALELGEVSVAVSVFDSLAKQDPAFLPRAEEARLAFRVANWPSEERGAARAPRLTRAAAATLVWWMYPEIRDARVEKGVIASDALSRRDSRALLRAATLGLLDVDRETHRLNPDARLTNAAAARLLLRLLLVVTPANREIPCLGESRRVPRAASGALSAAQDCGLLAESDISGVSGPLFTRALDHVRALASSEQEDSDE